MRKPHLLFLLLFSAALSFGQESIDVDFFRDLTDTINNFDLSQLNSVSEGILFLPSVYLSRKNQTYASFGIMFNNPFYENPQQENDDEEIFLDEKHPTTILKAAFAVRRKKTIVTLYFDYNSDYSWGLSLKIRF